MSQFGFQMNAAPPRKRSIWQFVAAWIAVVAVIGFGVQQLVGGPPDFEPDTQRGEVTVTVNSGDTLSVIGRTLKDAGVVASVDAFIQASEANPDARFITPGDYRIATHIPAATAITLLLSQESRDEVRIVIPEGSRAEEIYGIVAKQLGIPVQDVSAAFAAVALPASANGKPEGFLFPATYSVPRTATPAEVAEKMVARYRQAAAELELERRARAQQMTVTEVMIIASLLEGEAAPRDYAKVARVVLNRLAIDMPLQFDSTVNYGLGIDKIQLTTAQLQKDGPYNTYTRTGLPPTPINNPGEAAIEAALSPARGEWLYFVATNPAKKITEFAVSYDEFLRLKAKFKRAIS